MIVAGGRRMTLGRTRTSRVRLGNRYVFTARAEFDSRAVELGNARD